MKRKRDPMKMEKRRRRNTRRKINIRIKRGKKNKTKRNLPNLILKIPNIARTM